MGINFSIIGTTHISIVKIILKKVPKCSNKHVTGIRHGKSTKANTINLPSLQTRCKMWYFGNNTLNKMLITIRPDSFSEAIDYKTA